LRFYALQDIERRCKIRIEYLNLKKMRVMSFIGQANQPSVWFSLVETLKADGKEVRDDARELVLYILALVGH